MKLKIISNYKYYNLENYNYVLSYAFNTFSINYGWKISANLIIKILM